MKKAVIFLFISVILAFSVVPVSAIDTSNWVPGVKPGDYAEYKLFEISMNGVTIDLNIHMNVTVTEVRNNSYDWSERIFGNIEFYGNVLGYVTNDTEENVSLAWIVMPINLRDGEVIDSRYYSAVGEGINITAGHAITVHYGRIKINGVEFDAFYIDYSWNFTSNNETYSYGLRGYYHRDSGFLLKLEYYITNASEVTAQQSSAGFGYILTKSNKVTFTDYTLFIALGIVAAAVIIGVAAFIIIRRRILQQQSRENL